MAHERCSSSPQQQRLHGLYASSDVCRGEAVCLIEGDLDPARLWKAVESVVARHEILRTRLVRVPGLRHPVQEIGDVPDWHRCHVLRLGNGVHREFDLEPPASAAAPLCAGLARLDSRTSALSIRVSSLYADAATLVHLVREAAAFYDGDPHSPGAAGAPLQYADYTAWRDDLFRQPDELSEEGFSYWRSIASPAAPARLAGQRPAARRAASIGRVPIHLDAAVTACLQSVAERHQTSLAAALLACWGSLLHRLTEAAALRIGVVLDGRPYDELREGMGPYAQAVPMTMSISAAADFPMLLRETSDALERAALWQNYYRWPENDGDPELCSFGYAFHPPAAGHSSATVTLTVCALRTIADRFELQLECFQTADGIRGTLTYDAGAFGRPHVEQVARRWEMLCRDAAEAPHKAIRELKVTTPEDERRLLVEWNRPEDRPVVAQCVNECFEEQSARTPAAPAVVCGDRRLTYRELSDRAGELAMRLRAAGVTRETPVCLLIGRSVELIVGIFAVLKAGGAFVPLDTAHPVRDRIDYIIRDTGAPVVLTDTRFRPYLPASAPHVICVDAPAGAAGVPGEQFGPATTPDNLAYIIYTSGSTGLPKGVMVQHRSAVNLWHALNERIYAAHPGPRRVTMNAPVSFDASVKQILTLLGGHTLTILPEDVRRDTTAFLAYLRENEVDVLDCTPSHVRALVDGGLLEADDAPALALLGGEAIDPALWGALAGARTTFYNLYGPTECTVDCTAATVSSDLEPAIGKPLKNVKAYVLDRALELRPVGTIGELCIGGDGLARGYWRRPDLTAERFVPNPFSTRPGQRLYRTGDLARHLPDGSVQSVGRLDHQVKIRGIRVELDEISGAVAQHPSVREAAAAAWDTAPGESRIAAYIVPQAGAAPSASELRLFLEARLPEYMIPTDVVPLDALPLTPNGKLDRRALPHPDASSGHAGETRQPPATEVEMALARIWSSVLSVPHVGVTDNFFALGGHSLLAMQVIARVRKEFAIDIGLPRLFQSPTIEGLARAVEEQVRRADIESPIPALSRIEIDSATTVTETR